MGEDLHKRALDLELKKRFVEAGEIWETLGQIDKAIFNYHRSGNVKRAIDLALARGLPRKAAELYLKAEIYDKAAELYHKERDYGAAARAYRQGGRLVEAAAMFEKAEELSEAARLYESVNDFLKAGELYERGGDLVNSARVYELAIDAKTVDRLGGKKDIARVAQILTKVKNFEKAAEIYVQSQEVSEAVLMFVKMGEVEGAARLLANCQGDVGFEVLARIDFDDPGAIEFARMFYLAKDYGKAARVFESCKELEKAAYLYEKNQDYAQAAEIYAAAGELLRAAEMFEKAALYRDAGDFYLRAKDSARAASCYEAAEDFYQAGKLYFEVERYDKSIDLLQKVAEDHPRYLDASALIAELLRRKGYLDLAVERYRKIVHGVKCDPGTVDHFYNLACIMMEKRDYEEAERLLAEVVRFKFGFQDAASLLEQVRRLKAMPPATIPAPPKHAYPPPPFPAAAEAASPALAAAPAPSSAAAEPAQAAAPAEPVEAAAAAAEESEGSPFDTHPGAFVVGRMEGFEVLAGTPLFEELSLGEMKRFWEICEPRSAQAGALVLDEGVEGTGLYVIRSGSVNVVKGSEILVQLHAGDFFAEMSLIDPRALTSARITAATDVEMFFLGRDEFNRLLRSNDHTALKMYRVFVSTLAARLRKASEELGALKAQAGSG